VGLIGLALLIIILFSGMPVGFVMGVIGFAGMVVISGWDAGLGMLKTVPYATIASYSLSCIPLFIIMGTFCYHAGLTQELFYSAHKFLGHLPGGLAMATIAACAGFSAVSGSSVACAAAMGAIALPEMKRYGYDPALATGSVAAGGTLDIMIPPSVVFIIYGIITGTSIGKLFIAGFIPGFLLALFYIATIYIRCRRNPNLGPSVARASFKEMVFSLKNTWGVLILFILIIGGLYLGVFSPTEAAGIGAFGSLLFVIGRRRFNWQAFKNSLIDTSKITSMILTIIIGTTLLGYFLSVSRLPSGVASFMVSLPVNRYVILGGILIIYLILGTFMDAIAMLMITLPIFFPVITGLGFDPVWFGVICIVVVELGLITPPEGMTVYVVKAVAKDVSLATIFRGLLPFVVADLCAVIVLVTLPQISLFLPNMME